jgi:ubiquinone biosynthesis protein COQ4
MEEAAIVHSASDEDGADLADAKARRGLKPQEIAYMRGGMEPATSSVLTSSSKYLNDPYYRDTFAQYGLRKIGDDLPPTYLIPNMIRALAEVRDDAEFLALVQAERAKNPAFAAWLDRRRLTTYRPAEMRHYPDDTLGGRIRDFIEKSGMEMQFMKAGLEPRNDIEYMIKRRAAHHDIEHIVTGFGPNALGEPALAIMNNVSILNHITPALAKYLNEANMFITATGIFRASLHTPELLLDLYTAWELAIGAGNAIRMPLFMVDWEDYLDKTPDEICADLGFRRGPAEAWSYSNKLANFLGD